MDTTRCFGLLCIDPSLAERALGEQKDELDQMLLPLQVSALARLSGQLEQAKTPNDVILAAKRGLAMIHRGERNAHDLTDECQNVLEQLAQYEAQLRTVSESN